MKRSFYLVLIIFCFTTTNIYSQEGLPNDNEKLTKEIPNLKNGFVTITTNQRLKFKNLRTEGIEVVFYNIKTSSDYRYLKNTIKKIEDDSLNIVYVNPKFINEPNIWEKKVDKISTLYKANYPEGVYYTMEDFLNKKPSSAESIYAAGLDDFDEDIIIIVEDNCYFHEKVSGKKIRKAFAISFNGFLYFQIKAILNNRNLTDRAQKNDYPNSFVRVKKGGDNYLYTEAPLVNLWAEAGAFAGTGNYALTQSMTTLKGIVWDFKNKEFNIFKNCKDFNNFILNILPEKTQECEGNQPDLKEVRIAMELIK